MRQLADVASLVEIARLRALESPCRVAYTFLADGESETARWSYGELDGRAAAIAARLEALGARGRRALLLYPPGLEFIAAFFGCLYAGAVAVPAYPPRRRRADPRLPAILRDARPRVILTCAAMLDRVRDALADQTRDLDPLTWVASDALDPDPPEAWSGELPEKDRLAFLQYTSGSTSAPKGVRVTHGNLVANEEMIRRSFGHSEDTVVVGWLPIFHDMGLIGNVLAPLYSGGRCVLMSPMSFLQKPVRWLRTISRYGGTSCGGPDFAYELCVRKVTEKQCEDLDLSSWQRAYNGSEPVRAETLERFAERFAPCGFRREALYPCYGLAEATLLVTGGLGMVPVETCTVDAAALEEHRVVPAPGEDGGPRPPAGGPGPASRRLVSCGRPWLDQDVRIVDPETARVCPPDRVGEIWVAGPNVADGYWDRPEETAEAFGAYLADTGEGPFLRTGDLGFVAGGELYVTGRKKDLIIVRGRNYYPQDVELTVERSHPAVAPGCAAAFSVEVDGEERPVVVAELLPRAKVEAGEVLAAARRAVGAEHGLEVQAVAILEPRGVLRTSSGKVRRQACRKAFLDGTLKVASRWVRPAPSREPSPGEPATGPDAAGPRPPATRDEVVTRLVARLSELLDLRPGTIDPGEPLASYGLSSLQAATLAEELAVWTGRDLPATLVFDHPTVGALARHLLGEDEAAASPVGGAPGNAAGEAIAIVGIACRFPGAPDREAFWRLLRDGVDAVTEVPGDRWPVDEYYDPEPAALGTMNTRWGGFLAGVDRFDAHLFGISPREAERMDPQQRLLLETAWQALDDAALAPEPLRGSATGVFVGISTGDYGQERLGDPRTLDAYAGTGNALSIAANRLSFAFDLRGPSVAVDTACSSALTAVELACQSLRAGACDLALAGGVNLVLSPSPTIIFSKAGLLAPDGRCKAFDARADGYVRGEGVGLAVLRPLSRARAAGDRVYAVLRGGAIQQDGRSNGLTAPNRLAQESLLRAAYRQAGVRPEEVEYVEAHGSGTPLGDPIEARALGAVVGRGRSAGRPCRIGSVKTNLGHLEAAAGIAGLLKVALSLHHRELPPSLHFRKANPQIPLAELGLTVQRKLEPWPADGAPARAGVSSFGFGGTNVHLVVEEALPAVPSGPSREWQLLLLSARTPSALDAAAGDLAAFLRSGRAAALADVAYTLQAGRRSLEHRRAVLCREPEDAAEALESSAPERVWTHEVPPAAGPAGVSFVFPGVGDHYPGMARGLYLEEPRFRDAVDRCAELLRPELGLDVRDVVFGEGWSTDTRTEARTPEARTPDARTPDARTPDPDLRTMLGRGTPDAADGDPLGATAIAHPAIFTVEYALARLLIGWGIRPRALLGYSLGEYVAACLAGVFSVEDALVLVARRARRLGELPAGAMLAVSAGEDQVRPLLGEELSLAAADAPEVCVVAGSRAAVDELASRLAEAGIVCRRLPSEHAFHSRRVEPAAAGVAELVAACERRPPSLPLLSNLTGTWMSAEEATDPAYWARHTVATVRFAAGAGELLRREPGIVLEVGPGRSLGSFVRQHPQCGEGRPVLATLPARYDRTPETAFLLTALGKLWLAGAEVDWEGFRGEEKRRRTSLPSYPFERRRYWIEPRRSAAGDTRPRPAEGKLELERWFHAPVWHESVTRPPAGIAGPGSACLVFLDGTGLGAALAGELEDRSCEVTTVAAGEGFRAAGPAGYTVHPGRRGDYGELVAALEAGGRWPDRIVHLWGVGGASPAGDVEAVLEEGFGSLLWLAQALGAARGERRAEIAVVADGLESVSGDEALRPAKALALGPVLVIPLEYPRLACRSIDVAPAGGSAAGAALVANLADELLGGDPGTRVALRGRRRFVRAFEAVPIAAGAEDRAPIRPGGVYLITGGLGGLGLAVAGDLGRRGGLKLVLAGRRGLPPEDAWPAVLESSGAEDRQARAIAAVRSMRAAGNEVWPARLDVADAAAVRRTVAEIRERWGALHGVVHAAGVPGTGLIETRGPAAAAATAVLAPKVQGTLALAGALRGEDLDFLALFSSIAAITGGGPGQVDYAAANAFLGAFAASAESPPGTVSIDWAEWRWDAWEDARASLGPELRELFRDHRRRWGITSGEGTSALRRILARRLTGVVVCPEDLDAFFERGRSFTATAVLERYGRARRSAAVHPRPVLGTSYVAPGSDAERRVAALWAELLGVDKVGIHDNFFELGGNSLLGVALVDRLRREHAAEIPRHALFEAPTVSALAALLDGGGDASEAAVDERRRRGELRRRRRRARRGAAP